MSRRARQTAGGYWRYGLALLVAVLAVGVVGMILPRLGSSDPEFATELPVGPATAVGVIVDPPVVDLGHVPLDVLARHTFRLVNTGAGSVQLGLPSVAVLDGC